MKNKLALLALCTAVASGSFAAPITPEQALARIASDRLSKSGTIESPRSLQLVHTAKMSDGTAVAYVFTPESGRGFTIASANDVAAPVLGYSAASAFDADDMPVQLTWWLSEMGRRIKFLESRGIKSATAPYAPAEWQPVGPLCSTMWNQGAPYDRMTPQINGKQTPTGCVATSFAQAMNYFKYPERGTGSVNYKWNGKNLKLYLELKEIQWDKMLDQYTTGNYTDEQADAVAYLMKACGYTVEMNYGENMSGAMSYKLQKALIDNFGYDGNLSYEDRALYSSSQWAQMIYDNVRNIGPVIYDGTALEGGHSFICDGYSGDGYFHFNWGWGGISDGYYLLDVLNPESQGTGGAVGGFNWGQGAIIGMQKPTGQPVLPKYSRLLQYGNTKGTLKGSVIDWQLDGSSQLGWGVGSNADGGGTLQVGAIVENLGSGEEVIAEGGMGRLGSDVTINVGYWLPLENTHPVIQLPANLSDGTYKVTLATRDTNPEFEDAPWLPVYIQYGFNNFVLLTVSEGVYSISNQPVQQLTFEDMSFVNNLYYGKNTMMKGKILNKTDLDLTSCIQPVLVRNNKQQFVGDIILVSANAHEEVEKEWIVAFYESAEADQFSPGQTYTLKLFDKTIGEYVGSFGDVTMDMVSGTLKVAVNDFSVVGADKETVTVGSREFKNTYMVTENTDGAIDINLDYEVTSGYLDGSVSVGYQWYNPETGAYERIPGYIYNNFPFLAGGQGATLALQLPAANLKTSGVYNVVASYYSAGKENRMGSIYFAFRPAGIESVVDDCTVDMKYFNLQGQPVENPVKGQLLIVITPEGAKKIIY